MAKKFISIVLSVIIAFSAFAICSFAGDTISAEDRELYPAEELAIADPKDRIDRALLSGRRLSTMLATTAASKDILEDNLSYWKDEIIDEYHALEAKGDAATDEEWGALYRKMKTPHDNNFDEWANEWYEYKDDSKAVVDAKFVASKTELQPGEEFTVDLYITTNFWFSHMYATVFYDNSVVDVVGCDESYCDEESAAGIKEKHTEDIDVHSLGEALGSYSYAEINHYGYYPRIGIGDTRSWEWPDSLKADASNYSKYEGYNIGIYPSFDVSTCPSLKCDNTKIITYKFKVKDNAKPGSVSPIFAPQDSIFSHSKIDVYDGYSEAYPTTTGFTPCWQFMRVNKDSDAMLVYIADQHYQYDQKLSIEGTEIKIAGAQVEGADYTALDAAVAEFDSSLSGLYTKDSWSAYASAVTAGSTLSRDLTKDEQSVVDDATAAITDAKAALVRNHIVSVDVIGTPTIGSNANVQVVATGSPKAVRLVNEDGNTITFNREDATISTNGDNEVWNIKVAATSAEAKYAVFVKYGDEFDSEGLPLVINATEGLDLSIHSISVPDMYPTGTYMGGKIYSGYHDVIIRTSKDVFKIQFIDPDGNTRTFDQKTWTPVVDGDELVWTVSVNFYLGNFNFGLRTRAENTTFALTGDYITGRAVF